jgi:hypothetical protein
MIPQARVAEPESSSAVKLVGERVCAVPVRRGTRALSPGLSRRRTRVSQNDEHGVYIVCARCGYLWKAITDPPGNLKCPACQHGESWRFSSLEAARHRAAGPGRRSTGRDPEWRA